MAPRKKTETEELVDAEKEQQIEELRHMGYTWRDIEDETGISYETARRIYNKAQKRAVKAYTDFNMKTHIASDLARYEIMIRHLWRAWLGTVGELEETTLDSGSNHMGPYDKEKIKRWVSVGNPEFIKTIDTLMDKRNRLLHAYEKDRDEDDKVDLVRFEQNIYIPGLGELTPELMQLLVSAIEAKSE